MTASSLLHPTDWGLRDYGHPDQFGLEPTPQEYVAKLVDLFARLRPALKDEGTVWLNLGDSYASGTGNKCITPQTAYITGRAGGEPWGAPHKTLEYGKTDAGFRDYGVLKPKDLVGIPWRVAFALQDDGWYLRSDIIWAKKNCMPESVTDRPTKAHEYVFLLSKQASYYFDVDAVREPHAEVSLARVLSPFHTSSTVAGRAVNQTEGDGDMSRFCHPLGRNIRTVWTIATQPYSGAHFAVFPQELAERCIKAGCPEGGTVLDPFAGSGTTLYVARKLGRNSIGFELNEDYRPLIEDRLKQQVLL